MAFTTKGHIDWQILFLLMTCFWAVLAYEETNMAQKLKDKLLITNKYDKDIRPAIHHSNGTAVTVRLAPLYLLDLDEDMSLMTMDAWVLLIWTDHRLSWDEKEYGGLNLLHLGDGVIWQPDITVYNSRNSNIDPKGKTHALVYSSGTVMWVPPATLTTHCNPEDLHLYPEDVQSCDVILGSWTHHGYQIELKTNEDKTIDLSEYRDSNFRWEFLGERTNVSLEVKFYNCCEEPYYSVRHTFYFKRKYPDHLRVVYLPCILVMLMTLSLFWIPLLSGRKTAFGAFLFLILTVLMVYVASATKPTNAQYHAVSFVRSMMYAVMLAILLEVLVMNLANIRSQYQPPRPVLVFLSTTAAKALLVWTPMASKDATDQDEFQSLESGKTSAPSFLHEWVMVATALDRVLFIIFAIVFIAMYS